MRRLFSATISLHVIVGALAVAGLLVSVPSVGQAINIDTGLETTAGVAFKDAPELRQKADPVQVAGRLIAFTLSFVGTVFLMLIIYGGFQWMTAGGNDEKVGRAITIATQASIGLAIIMAAYLITQYVGNAFITILQ